MSDFLTTPITSVVYALVLWWFTTGLIMAVFKRSPRTIKICFGVATLIMIGAMIGLAWSARNLRPASVYFAVTCGTIVWGWHVASYYLGFVTGTTDKDSAQGWTAYEQEVSDESTEQPDVNNQTIRGFWKGAAVDGLRFLFPNRFRQAVLASLHHELLVLVFFVLIVAITLPHPNRWGLWIFLTLWLMHTSAKLNIFFGVRNFRVDFLPEHLHFLKQFVTKRKSNPFFPISICIASSIGLFLLYQVIDPASAAAHSAGAALIGTMILLGILEHWMLVLPIPVALWGWGVRQLPEQTVEG